MLTATKVDSTNLSLLASNAQRICPVAVLEHTTTGLVAKRLNLSRHTSFDALPVLHLECFTSFVSATVLQI